MGAIVKYLLTWLCCNVYRRLDNFLMSPSHAPRPNIRDSTSIDPFLTDVFVGSPSSRSSPEDGKA